ncbi:hypothetical protein I79_019944 [Cricetulus griseus]|uniref:Uncharacterized protein n=1 Tax=Cricetulus griseus TaxID=10029 RepID=G3I8R7_CRIGR|nr:hypothetical protein I79_019944 [Cricetulus griseus]
MSYVIHVWTSYRIFTPKIRAALRSQVLNLIGNIFRCSTYTGHNTEAWCAGAGTDLPDICIIRRAAQSRTALQLLEALFLLQVWSL